MRYPILIGAMLVASTLPASQAAAQARAGDFQRRIENAYVAPRVQRSVRPPTAPGARNRAPVKPFSNLQRSPTISPYLNLGRDDGLDTLPNYFSLVRPQLEQQAINRQQNRRLQSLGRDVQQIQQSAFDPAGSEQIRATGHTTRFLNTLQFFPR